MATFLELFEARRKVVATVAAAVEAAALRGSVSDLRPSKAMMPRTSPHGYTPWSSIFTPTSSQAMNTFSTEHFVFGRSFELKITFKVCVRCTPLREGKC